METNYKNKKLILASQSPRRYSLLKKICSNFEVVEPDFDESLDTDEFTDETVKFLSFQKALSVIKRDNPKNSLVISADTVVILNNKILGKPKDEANACEMLRALSGKTHFVATAVTVFDSDSKQSLTEIVKTFVTFQDLGDDLIFDYVKRFRPLDKAGAYGIQEMGSEFVKNVDGSLENVIGLPVEKLDEMIQGF